MTALAQARHRVALAARGLARRGAQSGVGRRVRRPMVSVIVPFYNVEKYLAACLDSILAQTTSDFEVLLVDDGSPDGSCTIAEAYVARDPRFRLLTRTNGGLGAARNTGVRAARGRYLTFVDSDDLLPPNAIAALRASAQRTGSDIVVGGVERFDGVSSWSPAWVRDLHTVRLERVRLLEFLPLLRNLYTWNKLYRRDFWDRQGLEFREGVAYEDQPIVTQLLLAADSIDVIPDIVYEYRARDDSSSISQQTSTLRDLRDRVAAWRATEEALSHAPDEVHVAWQQTLLDAHFIWYLNSSGTSDDEYWTLLRDAVVDLTADLPDQVWEQAPPANRVLVELARQDRRADVQEYARLQVAKNLQEYAGRPTKDGIVLELPFSGDPDLPDDLFVLRPSQIEVAHLVESVLWETDSTSGGGLHLSGWAFLLKLDLGHHDSHVDVVLREAGGAEHVVPATDGVAVRSQPPRGDEWADYRPGSFAATVPFELLDQLPSGTSWEVQLRVTAAGFVLSAPATRLMRAGSPGALEPVWQDDGTRLVVDWHHRQPATVRRLAPGVRVERLRIEGRTVTGELSGPGAEEVRDVEALAGVRLGIARVTSGRPATFALTLPEGGRGTTSWEVRGRTARRAVVPLELPDLDDAVAATPPGSVLQATRSRLGQLGLTEQTAGVEVDHVTVRDDDTLEIAGRVFGVGVTGVRVATQSVKTTGHSAEAPVEDGRFTAAVPLRYDAFRYGSWPLPYADHRVTVELLGTGPGANASPKVGISPALNRVLPVEVRTDVLEGLVRRGPGNSLEVSLSRPLGDHLSRFGQASLQREFSSAPPARATTRGLLVRSYFGEKATDNGVAIQAELRRRGSDLPVYWAVQDHSIPVPEGSIPVVVNSREWLELAFSATYYLDNMYQPGYHHKPEGQVFVETFHGYPFKQMGLPHWRHQHFPQSKIDSYARRSAEWDYLLSPATYATPLLTRDFGYSGPVLEIGYPRNDVLQSPEADDIRLQTRASFGIREDQTVVLYAPTFRDYLARNDNRAAMSDFFDFERFAEAYGDDVVVLMRGHAFHARTRQRVGDRGRMLDVTDYPEVSDLYLAADAAVVDYSSLRFDFAITGKPMVFLVPDLERYVESRGWLFDFGASAPGPHVSTTDQVIAELADLDALRARHAEEYALFRKTYLDLEDGHAAARFVDAVMAPRGDA